MNHTGPLPTGARNPLHYWLDSDVARLAPAATTSALRDMAWTYGQWRGLAAAMAGLGAALLAGGLLALGMMTSTPALWLSLILTALAMLGVYTYIQRAKLPKIARTAQPRISRAPAKTSSGVGLAGLITLGVGAPMALALHGWLAQGPGPAFSFITVAVLFLVGNASVFGAPAYCAQHARRGFRSYIAKNAPFRQELLALSLTWDDPSGNRNFGPL